MKSPETESPKNFLYLQNLDFQPTGYLLGPDILTTPTEIFSIIVTVNQASPILEDSTKKQLQFYDFHGILESTTIIHQEIVSQTKTLTSIRIFVPLTQKQLSAINPKATKATDFWY